MHGDPMKSLLKTLSSLIVSALMALPMPALSVEGVPINEHLGQWSAAVGPYSAGNMVIHDHKTWLSLVNGNDSKPGARNAAERWRLVGHARPSDYRVGDQGPGGGVIFFVDRDDQFPHFDYLEAAPDDLGDHVWCNRTNVSISGAKARAVGKGQANTRAMLRMCNAGAAQAATGYRGPRGKDDWFLPSLGELKLMYRFAEQSGKIGTIDSSPFWSSSETSARIAGYQAFYSGEPTYYTKGFKLRVRPIRAF